MKTIYSCSTCRLHCEAWWECSVIFCIRTLQENHTLSEISLGETKLHLTRKQMSKQVWARIPWGRSESAKLWLQIQKVKLQAGLIWSRTTVILLMYLSNNETFGRFVLIRYCHVLVGTCRWTFVYRSAMSSHPDKFNWSCYQWWNLF